MSQKIYCVSGLAADEKLFSKLHLPGTELIFLPWLLPKPQEALADYARRMFEQVAEENPVMLGLSFGGMTCIEIAKQFPVKKLFLISSIKTKQELPLWMKGTMKLRLHQFIRPRPHPFLYPLENFFLGVETAEERKLANSFRKQVQQDYLQWAIHQIVSWKNVTIPENITQIHGTRDKIFPLRYVKPDFIIEQGSHFMVYNKAEAISSIISRELKHQLFCC